MSKVDLPLVLLGEVAKPIARPVNVLPGQSYRTLGVKWWGEGAYERETIDGSKTAASQLYEVHEGDLIINKIWVRHGSIGIVPARMHGCAGSGEFPTFDLDSDRVLPRWIHWYSKTREMWSKCDALSQGTSGKNRIKPEKFLTVAVPLPPLSEQRRIVAKIEQLASKIEEARGLRGKSAGEADILQASIFSRVLPEHVAKWNSNRVSFADVAKVARGKFGHRPRNDPRFYGGDIPFIQINDISDASRYIRRFSQTLNEDGLCISRMFPKGTVVIAITGATVGVTGILDFDSCFPDSIVGYVPDPDRITPEFLHYSVESEKHQALEQATQTTQPNINLRILDGLKLAIPPLPEQRRIVAYLDDLLAKVDQLKTLQAETAAELDALLPSILDRAFCGEL